MLTALSEPSTVQVIGFVSVLIGAIVAAWFGYRGQVIGAQAKRIAERVERQVTPNGGTQPTTGDATVRMEAGLTAMQQLVAQAVAELQAAVTRDDGRFARSEREMAELRGDVRTMADTVRQVATDHGAIMEWIETHTTWAHDTVQRAEERAENTAARLAALEQAELERREREQ